MPTARCGSRCPSPGKVGYGDFMTLSRQLSLEQPVAEAGDICRIG